MLDSTLGLPVMMIATVSGCVSRHASSSSMPETCAMCRSSSTMSNGRRFSMTSASMPLRHTLTSKPSTPSTLAQQRVLVVDDQNADGVPDFLRRSESVAFTSSAIDSIPDPVRLIRLETAGALFMWNATPVPDGCGVASTLSKSLALRQ
jgi:hypothetical protein